MAGRECCWWCLGQAGSHTRRRPPGEVSAVRVRHRSASRTAAGCEYPAPTGTLSVLQYDTYRLHIVDRVETYLFHGRDRRRVLPGRTSTRCSLRTRDAISRHA